MKAPRRAALARRAPRRARELSTAPRTAPGQPAGPLIRITVTVELSGRLTALPAAAAALVHLLRHCW